MITAAPDPLAARAVVDRAEATMGVDDYCGFCSIMLAVPAVIACAQCGDIERARHHLAIAEQSSTMWDGTAWEGWLAEARAHLAAAEGDHAAAARLLDVAVARFDAAGQPLDAARCRTPIAAPS
jgi:hypothetical protein